MIGTRPMYALAPVAILPRCHERTNLFCFGNRRAVFDSAHMHGARGMGLSGCFTSRAA